MVSVSPDVDREGGAFGLVGGPFVLHRPLIPQQSSTNHQRDARIAPKVVDLAACLDGVEDRLKPLGHGHPHHSGLNLPGWRHRSLDPKPVFAREAEEVGPVHRKPNVLAPQADGVR
jgi:hypothetical protein